MKKVVGRAVFISIFVDIGVRGTCRPAQAALAQTGLFGLATDAEGHLQMELISVRRRFDRRRYLKDWLTGSSSSSRYGIFAKDCLLCPD